MIKAVLAESLPLVAAGIEACLRPAGFDIAGVVADTHSLKSLVELVRPDLIIVELSAENRRERLAAIDGLVRRYESRVLALTSEITAAGVQSALEGGCLGVAPRTASTASFVDAARTVAAGHEYVHPLALTAILESMQSIGAPGERVTLTAREVSVLALVAEGCTNAVVAERLEIAATTVKTHVERILRKLAAHDRAHAVRNAIRLGLLE